MTLGKRERRLHETTGGEQDRAAKTVTESAGPPTTLAKPRNGATRKRVEPPAKKSAIQRSRVMTTPKCPWSQPGHLGDRGNALLPTRAIEVGGGASGGISSTISVSTPRMLWQSPRGVLSDRRADDLSACLGPQVPGL